MSNVTGTSTAALGGVGGVGLGDAGLARDLRTDVTSKGVEFRDAMTRAAAIAAAAAPAAASGAGAAGLKFSAHAVDRMKSRGIAITPNEMKGIENAVERAASKGSRDTLVLAGENALIVSVKNKTVVTVMDRSAMRDNVFTNIDSTVVI